LLRQSNISGKLILSKENLSRSIPQRFWGVVVLIRVRILLRWLPMPNIY